MTDRSDPPTVMTERDRAVMNITISRESSGNAIDTATAKRLRAILSQTEDVSDVSALVLRSAGTRYFCTGGDVKEYGFLDRDQLAETFQTMTEVCWLLEAFPVPVIAAISGATLGGGLELALACDIRVASRTSWFQFPNVGLGVITAWGGGRRLADTVGRARAIEMLSLRSRIQADEALHIGLINRVVDDADQAAGEMAREVSGAPRAALVAAKAELRRGSISEQESTSAVLDLWFQHGIIHKGSAS